MDLESLEFKNFKPREGIEESSRELIRESLDATPIQGIAKVLVKDVNRSFQFSIVAKVKNQIISNDLEYKKKDLHGWPRDWQYSVLCRLIYDFLRNLKSHQLIEKVKMPLQGFDKKKAP